MNLKIKDTPQEQNGILAGVALLILALGFMVFKLWSLQGQVSSLSENQKVLQTIPPSQQLTKEAEEKVEILDQLRTAKPADQNYAEDDYARQAKEEAAKRKNN